MSSEHDKEDNYSEPSSVSPCTTRSSDPAVPQALTGSPGDDTNALARSMSRVSYRSSIDSKKDVDLIYDSPEQFQRLEKIETNVRPNYQDVLEADPWKYPLDLNSNLRIVTFVDEDEDDPRRMSFVRKWVITVILGLVCFGVAFCSAVVTGDIKGPRDYFHVSTEVIILTVTLFVVGFGVGPLVFAPASEEFGRQIVYIVTFGFAVLFVIPCALARNIGTLLVCRLIDGIAFSAPMTVIGGSLADIWAVEERGIAMTVFSAAPFIGPALGPLVGGFIGDFMYWRWIYWISFFFVLGLYILLVLFVPETHHTTILRRRVKKLIKLTGDRRYVTAKDADPMPASELLKVTLLRPVQLLAEPIVFFITLYMTVLYGLLYMFFFAYPVVYGEGKGWSDHMTGLMFIPLAIGIILSACCAKFVNDDYNRRAKVFKDRGEPVPPEVRLIPMMFGAPFIPIGLFIFAWTSYPHVHWIGPAIGGAPVGFGFIFLYNAANNYLIDTYVHVAASALAAKTFVRSLWGAGCVLFTIQMYHTLGYEWASSLLAFIALACCLIPFCFYFLGAKIRARSKYAFNHNAASG
ncbi:hypothetical protein B9G98_02185 [Wickerhamiella sorbophila]|uniref:Major facilitator superfamily (MFS) profile domain-containing protein n=1 Tax=Wickerhamiella sorbophila TaxID=45607 RepID=A0A2T0FHV9_9ASCO|nr:hypothetical protein B9G98_02185 [Wickerhamiella sorbophila]PRT54565.1 hypothetical protein B9G98_02185 [Wickerhamiella sorbophila]